MDAVPIPDSPTALDALLKSQPGLWRGRDRYHDDKAMPTGFASLDKALPARGWCMAGVTEMLSHHQGIGEVSLLLPALSQITSDGQWAAFINPPYIPYAPALGNAGIHLERLLIINSGNDTDTLWSAEQLLRSGLFASVVVWVTRSNAQKQRRLQIAAESGKTWATIYRPWQAQDEHSPVSARMRLSIVNKQLRLELFKVRGGSPQSVIIEPSEFDASQGVEWPIPAA
ncbi:translesion DNA synthesis-associated protein ImuA [Granulosicoccus antarcticus]|uniref:Cell division inhibitor SulA n=1 Tax=Granulosicoccus antarcticus IMCC3135 TaxID=1192854 RepID=A0A2Z2P4A9_9GAMM|nr:translesion DNA synthesis-associated protein ImuA [Granulosicoccus antarcticus]ASJ74674.1 Cell division inhibitor SulA [Granulosicoccus antarcticus IMCC3135]